MEWAAIVKAYWDKCDEYNALTRPRMGEGNKLRVLPLVENMTPFQMEACFKIASKVNFVKWIDTVGPWDCPYPKPRKCGRFTAIWVEKKEDGKECTCVCMLGTRRVITESDRKSCYVRAYNQHGDDVVSSHFIAFKGQLAI